jgi:hypothetical protein
MGVRTGAPVFGFFTITSVSPGKQNVFRKEKRKVFVKEVIPVIPDIPIYMTEKRIA